MIFLSFLLIPLVLGAYLLDGYRLEKSLRTARDCHRYQAGPFFADGTCLQCSKSYRHWRHHPMKLQLHEYKPHIRRDIGTTTKFCDHCNKRKDFRMHVSESHPLSVESSIASLEKWHNEWRLQHPEYEDEKYLAIFPEFAPTETGNTN